MPAKSHATAPVGDLPDEPQSCPGAKSSHVWQIQPTWLQIDNGNGPPIGNTDRRARMDDNLSKSWTYRIPRDRPPISCVTPRLPAFAEPRLHPPETDSLTQEVLARILQIGDGMGQVLAEGSRSFRARLSERFQQPDGGPGGAPVVVDFVANDQAFGIGGLREVLGRSQPGTVGLLRREQPFASVSKDGRVNAGSGLRQNVDRQAGREGIAWYAFFPPPAAVAVASIEQLLTKPLNSLGRPEPTLKQ